MKAVLAGILLMLGIVGSAVADTGIFYNPNRVGEGAVVTVEEKRLSMIFFSHTALQNTVLPSPEPPEPLLCDENNVYLILVSDYFDGETATGGVYYHDPKDDFPIPDDDKLTDEHLVGSFMAEKYEDGFLLLMERDWIICDMSIFNVPIYLVQRLTPEPRQCE